MSEDSVIKNILLYDERKLNHTARLLMKWKTQSLQEEKDVSLLSKLYLSLSQLETNVDKSLLCFQMNMKEIETYQNLRMKILENIDETKSSIQESKQELLKEKQLRKNRMEYDSLANIIMQHPSRQQTERDMKQLKQDRIRLELERSQLDETLNLRRKQFRLLMNSLLELQSTLQPDTTSTIQHPASNKAVSMQVE